MLKEVSLDDALHSVKQIAHQDVHASIATFYSLIEVCISRKNISAGRELHTLIVATGYESNPFLVSHLIRLFAACGHLEVANQLFRKVREPDAFTWNAIISAHAKLGNDDQALAFYHRLNCSGSTPLDAHIFVAVLKACHSVECILLIHAHIIEDALDTGMYIPVTLLDAYTKYGNVEEVVSIFFALPDKTDVAWNAVIKGYTHHGHTDDALQVFAQMQTMGIPPTPVTFVNVLKACSNAAALSQGTIFHSQILACGTWSNITVRNTLIDMYSKCSSMDHARRVFENLPNRDLVTWNAMIAGFVQHGHNHEALKVFQEMHWMGLEANEITFSTVVKACSSSTIHSEQGKLVHDIIIESGFESNMYVANALINMYAKWGSVDDGSNVFTKLSKRNVVAWGAMIACYSQNEFGFEAFWAFLKMQTDGLSPNHVVYASILRACSDLGALDLGKLIHAHIIESDLAINVYVASTLIDMYTKTNSPADAYNVFHGFSRGNIVTWSAMIAGHAENGRNVEALQLFNCMRDDGLEPNEITFLALLSLCSNITALDQGMLVHAQIIEMGQEVDIPLTNSLVDMYANCGTLCDACRVLEKSAGTNVVTWNAIIAGCAKHNDYDAALYCLKAMQNTGVEPNDVTFVSILSLCNHLGLVHEGHFHLTSMREEYEILPRYEHYMCTIDLLGRAGHLNRAEDILNTMPSSPDMVALASLLIHCKVHKNAKLAKQCFNGMIAIDSRSASGFVHMSKIVVSDYLKEYSHLLEDFRNNANAWKKPGMACIEVEGTNYEFVVGDESFGQNVDMCTKMKLLSVHLRGAGYLPKSVSSFVISQVVKSE